ncbi:MAG TPA: TadE family protein [Anaeromyxobacteraceae bacterium]
MRSKRHGGRGRERGAAVVEFALVLPLLLMLVLGAIDWGWYFYLREVVTNAAREGARAGSVSALGSSAAAAAETAATTYLTNLGLGAGTATATTPVVSGTNTVRVVVTYTAGSLSGFTLPGFQSLVPANITATVQMRGEF